MKGKKMHLLPKLLFRLAILMIAAFCGVLGYLCIREGSVMKKVPAPEDYDAIIVLGAQVLPDGTPSVQLGWRLDAAYDAYQQKPVPVVVCGAQGPDEPMSEADAMETYLTRKGIPAEKILKDPESFNTRQNMTNAAKLLDGNPGIRKTLIVTSDYHVPRALALARDVGFEACGFGSPCKAEYWIKNHVREALAWCKYWGVKYLHLPLE